MRFVDANVFIYAFIQSPKKDFDVASEILTRIEKGEETFITLPVFQEVVDLLEYNNWRKEVTSFLIAINSYVSLQKITPTWKDYVPALDDMKKYGMEFVDALTLQEMKRCACPQIYSNDKDFDRVDWVKRIWE